MKTMKTLAAAIAVIAVFANAAFAEEFDDGIVSADATIDEPIDPQPGMKASAYQFEGYYSRNFAEICDQLPSKASIVNYVDRSGCFGRQPIQSDVKVNLIKWEGYIKCKQAGVFSFSFSAPDASYQNYLGYYSFTLNGEKIIEMDRRQQTVAGTLKLGWNKVVIVYEAHNEKAILQVKCKPNGSMSNPRPLTPAMMFYDRPVENNSWF